jgi:hypothetical protein
LAGRRGRRILALTHLLHFPSAAPAQTFGFGVLLLVLRVFSPFALTPDRLPAAQLAKAFRFLAVTLIPGSRQKLPTAAHSVTRPQRKPTGARRTPGRGAMLFSSHGRWCSRWGRPRDWLSPSGTFLLINPLPAVIPVSQIPAGLAQYTRYAWDRPTPVRPSLPPPFHPLHTTAPTARRARVPSRNGEGNREGDCLELARLLKETIPSK